MQFKKALLASAAVASAMALQPTRDTALAQTAAALSGQISSAAEAAMEGVLVSARRDGATITTADIKLRPTRNVSTQLTNAEWLASMPGTAAQKKILLNCAGCHTLERIVKSSHDAAEFAQVLDRMSGYYPGSMPIHPQRLAPTVRRDMARGSNLEASLKFLASINLSEGETWSYPL